MLQVFLQPLGRVLLAVLTLGLLGYISWRFFQAIWDPDYIGKDWKGIIQRAAFAISGFFYALIAFSAIELLTRGRSQSDSSTAHDWTAWLLHQPAGRWLVGLVGLVIVGVGLYQFYRTYSANFQKRFDFSKMSDTAHQWMIWLGRLGFFARGVVYLLVGAFLIQAAYTYDVSKAGGLGGALVDLLKQPYGEWLLGAVAVGLFAYGVYAITLARYRWISID